MWSFCVIVVVQRGAAWLAATGVKQSAVPHCQRSAAAHTHLHRSSRGGEKRLLHEHRHGMTVCRCACVRVAGRGCFHSSPCVFSLGSGRPLRFGWRAAAPGSCGQVGETPLVTSSLSHRTKRLNSDPRAPARDTRGREATTRTAPRNAASARRGQAHAKQ